MKLGEYIKNNNINNISVATDIENINDRVVFTDMDMIPVKYWEGDIKTFRHKIHLEDDVVKYIELIAIIKI